ncbi:hypothetical protein RYX36_002657 [Vicia faba]
MINHLKLKQNVWKIACRRCLERQGTQRPAAPEAIIQDAKAQQIHVVTRGPMTLMSGSRPCRQIKPTWSIMVKLC